MSDTAAEKGEAASGSEKASPRKKPLGAALRLLTVGPKGKFPTIAEALDYLRDNKDAYVPRDRRDAITIQITASGTLAERIQVDNSNFSLPRLPIQIIGVQEPRPVLSPPGEAPIITIQNVERLIVARLDLNAEKKPVAVRLEGSLQG
ncbi:MAG: hypothetical protein GXP27_12205, partial [Planctomycetes bacterium]|nr:hypothetical protein [Planctomycetota bacterium]